MLRRRLRARAAPTAGHRRPPAASAARQPRVHASDVLRRSDVCVVVLTRGPDVAAARAQLLTWQRALCAGVGVRWSHVGPPTGLPLPPLVTAVPGAAAADASADTGFARALNAARLTCGADVRAFALVRADLAVGPPPPGFGPALSAAVHRCTSLAGTAAGGRPPAVVSPHPPTADPLAGHCVLPAGALPLFEAHGQHADARVNALRLEADADLNPPLTLSLLPALAQPMASAGDALAVDALAASLCGCHGRHPRAVGGGGWPRGPQCRHRYSAYVRQLYDGQRTGQPLPVRLPAHNAALLHYNGSLLP